MIYLWFFDIFYSTKERLRHPSLPLCKDDTRLFNYTLIKRLPKDDFSLATTLEIFVSVFIVPNHLIAKIKQFVLRNLALGFQDLSSFKLGNFQCLINN